MSTSPTVLYVEDDPQSRKVMQIIFGIRMKLPKVIFFEDSQDFIPRVKSLESQPDIFFLDIHVKPYSGIDMLRMLRQQPQYRETPVVALTASVMNEEISLLRHTGFSGCLAKPVVMETFPDTFYRLLKGEYIWNVTA